MLPILVVIFTGCASHPEVKPQGHVGPRQSGSPTVLASAGTAAERLDKSRLELEEYKQAQRERYFRLQQKRLAEQHALPPEMPEVKLVSGASSGRTGQRSAADRADDWQRENAELLLAEQLRAVRQYQLKVRQYHNLPPEWLDERKTP
jgi:hypothetical protein